MEFDDSISASYTVHLFTKTNLIRSEVASTAGLLEKQTVSTSDIYPNSL